MTNTHTSTGTPATAIPTIVPVVPPVVVPTPVTPVVGELEYLLPSDCLRVQKLKHSHRNYRVSGGSLFSCDATAEIEYTRRVTDPSEFDNMFIDVLVLELALKMVMPLTQSEALRESIGQELSMVLATARLVNQVETMTRPGRNSWIESRRLNRSWW